jgi:hypothetical protein
MAVTLVVMNEKTSVLSGFFLIRRRHLASAYRGFQDAASAAGGQSAQLVSE